MPPAERTLSQATANAICCEQMGVAHDNGTVDVELAIGHSVAAHGEIGMGQNLRLGIEDFYADELLDKLAVGPKLTWPVRAYLRRTRAVAQDHMHA